MTDSESTEASSPAAELKFATKSGKEVTLRLTVAFEGEFLELFEGIEGATEQEARDGFALKFFEQVANLF